MYVSWLSSIFKIIVFGNFFFRLMVVCYFYYFWGFIWYFFVDFYFDENKDLNINVRLLVSNFVVLLF